MTVQKQNQKKIFFEFVTSLQKSNISYIRSMNKIVTIQKQVLALLLLGVFLFIHIGKSMHTHEISVLAEKSFPTEQVSKSNDCPVCDFHFTKDAEHEVKTNELSQPLPVAIQHTAFQSRHTASIGLSYSDRGPPALF